LLAGNTITQLRYEVVYIQIKGKLLFCKR
jgi:hypothetical protein